jgi:hypothetical protein
VLANHHPHLRFVVQDREQVVRDAVEVCALLFTKLPKYDMYGNMTCPTVLEGEHAQRSRIRPGGDPRFV